MGQDFLGHTKSIRSAPPPLDPFAPDPSMYMTFLKIAFIKLNFQFNFAKLNFFSQKLEFQIPSYTLR